MAGFKDTIQNAYLKFRDDITFGRYKPGEHLSERILTDQYGISRSSLRVIIGQLVSQGYLVVEANRGAMITKLTLVDIDIILNILVRCESYATYLFTQKKEASLIKKLARVHKKMESDDVLQKYKSWLDLNNQFHEIIYYNCGSQILKDLIEHTRSRIYRFRMLITDLERMITYNNQHYKILKEIEKGNPEDAEKIMILHMDEGRKNRMKTFKDMKELFIS